MVFLNYSTMQMVAKIVYYGPGLCGKTTNLKEIYRKTSPRSRGEMVSLETETDRTLFFDLLPMDVGVISGFKTKFQLYTVPGQVFYNSTRKLVLKGVDGVVFVADSQEPMLEANRNSFENLRQNLDELGMNIAEVPLIFQYNKRDLPNLIEVEALNRALNTLGRPYIRASAINGEGVFETLKEISKHTLLKLRAKTMGEEGKPAREEISLTVQGESEPESQVREKSRDFSLDLEEELDDAGVGDEGGPLAESEELPSDVSFEEEPIVPSDDLDSGSLDLEEPEVGLPDVSNPDEAEEVLSAGAIGDDPMDAIDDNLNDFDLDFSEDEHAGPGVSGKPPIGAPAGLGGEAGQAAAETPLESESPTVPGMPPASELLAETQDAQAAAMAALAESGEDAGLEKVTAKSNPAKKRALSSSLKEIESLATQIVSTRAVKEEGGEGSVDSLLEGLVEDGQRRSRPERFNLRAPAFAKAQLNCVFLDEDDNVVHAQLLKATPQETSDGKRRIHIAIDVDVER